MSEEASDWIEDLLEEFLQRLRCGETPSIAEYEALHPEDAARIRELFSAAQMMEGMAQRRPRDRGLAAWPFPPVERLGDYRMVREIGRGGMGIVYEAEQESLGRRVAVKVLPPSALVNPQALRRFKREAQTAARLHHTNIIPVFGVGEHQGYHYIVMQLILGVGLDTILARLAEDGAHNGAGGSRGKSESDDYSAAVIRAILEGEFRLSRAASGSKESEPDAPQSPSVNASIPASPADVAADETPPIAAGPGRLGPRYWESVARIGIQAANALQYAHTRGTLHRDIKPANLMIDLQGVVWIGDFGLAKAREHDDVSHMGDMAGTLRYMAPERFRGQADARSDLYSLGLSLYELLSLRPAYTSSDPGSLLQRITTQSPPPPRSVNPRIPADLETIVLKAISREPGDRYASAEELAHDLERYLDDRPIHARRVGLIEQAWRWSRRNRMVAALAGLAVFLLVLVAVVASVGYVQTRIANRQVREALASESRQLRRAEAERHRAEAISGLTLAALDSIFEQFVPSPAAGLSELSPGVSLEGEIGPPVQPVLSKEVVTLLERMLTFYERLAEQKTEDIEVRRKVADAHRRVGDIRRRLGHFEQAEAAYLQAIDGYREVARESREDAAVLLEIARIDNELGSLQWMARRTGDGRAFHRQAQEILTAAEATSPASAPRRYELARTYYFLGRGGPPDAVPGRQPPDNPRRDPPPKPKSDRQGPSDPAPADRTGVGPPPRTRDNEENLQRAVEILENLATEHPSVAEYRHLLACCYRDMPPGTPIAARDASQDPQSQAIAILKKLVEDFPDSPDFRYDLSKAYAKLDPRDPQFRDGRFGEAEKRLRSALDILDRLIGEHPNTPDYLASHVQISYLLSEVLRRIHRSEDAELVLRAGLTRQSSLADQFPDVHPYRAWKATLQESLAKMLSNRGELKEAKALLESAASDLEHLLKADSQALYVRSLLGRCYASLAEVVDESGDAERAREIRLQGRAYRSEP